MGLLQISCWTLFLGCITLAAGQGIRLPDVFTPANATIYLDFDSSMKSYSGREQISGKFSQATKTFALHADPNYLKISGVGVEVFSYGTWKTKNVTSYSSNATTQILTIELTEASTTDFIYRVTIDFGSIQTLAAPDGKSGMFYQKFSTNYKGTVVGTSFYPIQARTVFPCFDEPSFLVSYSLILNYRESYTLHAGTPIVSSKNHGILTRYTNATLAATPPLAAFQLGFYFVDGFSSKPIQSDDMRTKIFLPSKMSLISGSLEYYTNTSLLDIWVNDLPNITVIAVPELSGKIFSAYNLIVMDSYYAEERQDLTSEQTIDIITSIINALARQVFGNRLSIAWWGDAWILESFPIYLANSVIEKDAVWGPAYQALKARNLPSTLKVGMSIQKTITTTSGIHMSVKCKAKYKGAVLLSMFDNLMPNDNKIIDVIKTFLKKTEGGVATTKSFLAFLSGALKGDLAQSTDELAKWWSNQCVPTVKVTLDSFEEMTPECDGDQEVIIPVSFVTSDSPNEQYALISSIQDYSFDSLDWVLANPSAVGLYRVQYSQEASSALMSPLSSGSATPLQRAQAISDSFWGAFTDRLNFYSVLNLTNYMDNEYDFAPWSVVGDAYKNLELYMAFNQTLLQSYKDRVSKQVSDLFGEITARKTSPSSQLDIMREGVIVLLACDMGLQDCTNMAATVFKSGTYQNEFQDMQSTINCYGIKQTWDDKTWKSEYSKWLDNVRGYPTLWESYLDQLVCYKDPKYMLDTALKSHPNDFSDLYASLIKRTENVDTALDWLISNYKNLNKTVSDDVMCSVIESLGDVLVSMDEYKKLNNLTSQVDPNSAQGKSLSAALKNVFSNVQYITNMEFNWKNWIFGSAPSPKVMTTTPVPTTEASTTSVPTTNTTATSTTTTGPSSSSSSGPTGSTTSGPTSSTTSGPASSSTSGPSSTTPSGSTTPSPSTTSKPDGASEITLNAFVLLASLTLFYVR